jgi:hypothetical protein
VHGFAPLPVAEKSPLLAIALNVTELVLLFFTVSGFAVLVVPAACAAKATLAGLKVNGAVPPPDPVPDNATSCGENPEASVIASAPFTLPFAVGVNVTAILHFAFVANDAPQVVPVELTA